MGERYFITGAQGCIGSWIVKALIERGDEVIVFDRSDDSRRLAAIMNTGDLARVRFITGDITEGAAVLSALRASDAQRVIHLAGLQVPTCKADPVSGALVNVVGTLNVFEAARPTAVRTVVYASSAAVYGINDDPALDEIALDESVNCKPSTHYGVFKLTNEGNARIYFLDHGVSSVGLRPLTVYGVNRDTGLTSDPTKAMKSAVLGRPFHIRFSGATDFQYVADTAAAFIACADRAPAGAHVFNLHGKTLTVDQIAGFINEEAREELVTFSGPPIPIAPAIDDSSIKRTIGALPSTPYTDGIRETMKRFAELRDAGRLDISDIA
jgi:nucleoside-diphosphate-sugar epimerase